MEYKLINFYLLLTFLSINFVVYSGNSPSVINYIDFPMGLSVNAENFSMFNKIANDFSLAQISSNNQQYTIQFYPSNLSKTTKELALHMNQLDYVIDVKICNACVKFKKLSVVEVTFTPDAYKTYNENLIHWK